MSAKRFAKDLQQLGLMDRQSIQTVLHNNAVSERSEKEGSWQSKLHERTQVVAPVMYFDDYLTKNDSAGVGGGSTISSFLNRTLKGKAKSYAGKYAMALQKALDAAVAKGDVVKGKSVKGAVAYYSATTQESTEVAGNLCEMCGKPHMNEGNLCEKCGTQSEAFNVVDADVGMVLQWLKKNAVSLRFSMVAKVSGGAEKIFSIRPEAKKHFESLVKKAGFTVVPFKLRSGGAPTDSFLAQASGKTIFKHWDGEVGYYGVQGVSEEIQGMASFESAECAGCPVSEAFEGGCSTCLLTLEGEELKEQLRLVLEGMSTDPVLRARQRLDDAAKRGGLDEVVKATLKRIKATDDPGKVQGLVTVLDQVIAQLNTLRRQAQAKL